MRVGPTRRFWLAPPSCTGTGRGETDEPTCTPGSVAARRYRPGRWRPFILDHCHQWPRATYPLTRASSPRAPAVRSCSGRGLPSRGGHPSRWWALTPPFHPYPPESTGGLLSVALSRGSPRVAVSHRPALWSPDVPQPLTAVTATKVPRPPGRLVRRNQHSGIVPYRGSSTSRGLDLLETTPRPIMCGC